MAAIRRERLSSRQAGARLRQIGAVAVRDGRRGRLYHAPTYGYYVVVVPSVLGVTLEYYRSERECNC